MKKLLLLLSVILTLPVMGQTTFKLDAEDNKSAWNRLQELKKLAPSQKTNIKFSDSYRDTSTGFGRKSNWSVTWWTLYHPVASGNTVVYDAFASNTYVSKGRPLLPGFVYISSDYFAVADRFALRNGDTTIIYYMLHIESLRVFAFVHDSRYYRDSTGNFTRNSDGYLVPMAYTAEPLTEPKEPVAIYGKLSVPKSISKHGRGRIKLSVDFKKVGSGGRYNQ